MQAEIEINNQNDIDKYFPDEKSLRDYLAKIRWGKWPCCPYCGNPKAYFIENGKRYKCADKTCYKRFSITVKTLMEASNVPLAKWMKAVIVYIKLRGDCKIWDIEKSIDVVSKTAYFLKEKMDFCWPYVLKDDRTTHQMFVDFFTALFNLYDKAESLKRVTYLSGIDNISDIHQYRKVLRYTKGWVKHCHWIIEGAVEANEVISETFIYMADNGIKEYNSESLSFLLRKTCSKMWMQWVYAHPNTHRYYKNYWNEWNRRSIQRLSNTYINSKLRRSFPEKAASEIAADIKLREERIERIKTFRKKFNLLDEFNSHFD